MCNRDTLIESKKNSRAVKKGVAFKKARLRKDVKSKVQEMADGRLMAKILITTIQMNLVPNPSEEAMHIHLNCCY